MQLLFPQVFRTPELERREIERADLETEVAAAEAPVELLYATDDRSSAADRPWVMVNMVVSLDGATATDGVSGALGGEGDTRVFRAIRAIPDIIVAASGTVIAENYGQPVATPEVQSARIARGQAPVPRLGVISNSLGFDPDSRLFAANHRPLLITTTAAPKANRDVLTAHADFLVIDADPAAGGVDLAAAMRALHTSGVGVVLVEGGPTLNGQLAATGLVDEWCVTLAPTLVGGASKRMLTGPAVDPPQGLVLDRVLEHQGALFLRYVRPG